MPAIQPVPLRMLIAAAAFAIVAVRPAHAAPPLPVYNADIKESSISGISSGAFMAVQFGTAWSSIIKGVGVIAGGPYFCAEGAPTAIATGIINIANALSRCMKGVPAPTITPSLQAAGDAAHSGDIDPLSNLAKQAIYLLHGYNDSVIARSVTDQTEAFYRHYTGDKHKGGIFYQSSVAAGHSQVTAGFGIGCSKNEGHFIDNCGYDQAGIILQHIYGALVPANRGALTGRLIAFDQHAFTRPESPASLSLDDTGYAYVPASCEQMARCRVHIALHGCQQYAGLIKQDYVLHAGYNEWADTNNIIILYPQTTNAGTLAMKPFTPENPQGCWDWWGYTDFRYATRSGPQIQALKAMLDHATSGIKPQTASQSNVAPSALVATDSSDTAVALAWTPTEHATGYEIERGATPSGPFQAVGTTTGPSYADTGLTPTTHYAYRIKIIADGASASITPTIVATTQQTPPSCSTPGQCPIVAHQKAEQ